MRQNKVKLNTDRDSNKNKLLCRNLEVKNILIEGK